MNKVLCFGNIGRRVAVVGALAFSACATVGGGAPVGAEEKPDQEASALMKEVGGKANGTMAGVSPKLSCTRSRHSSESGRSTPSGFLKRAVRR